MSQEGIIDVIGTNPTIPTDFIANVGNAVPLANTLELLGAVVAAGTNPFRSIGSGNTITYQVQIAQAVASTNATNIGLSAFNSAQFSVDANGFVSLNAGSLVTSVTGTANRITAIPTTGNVVVDIAATYVGQTSITTLGTITTGTWHGTAIGPTFGGTGQTTYATGDILYASAANTLSKLAASTNGFVLALAAGIPSWVAPSGGTVTSVSGTLNRITSTGGTTPVIDISASYVGQASITTLGTITTGVWNGTAVDATHGGTAQTSWATGDILYASGVNTLSKLAAGSNTQVLTLAAGVPTWATPTTGTVTSVSGTANRITSTGGATPVIDISAAYVGQTSITTLGTITTGVWNGTVVALAFGGTNANLTASNGGIFYSTSTAGAILSGTATAGQHLQSGASAAPSWTTATFPSTATSTGTILRADGTNWVATTATYPATTTSQQILYSTATNVIGQLTTANSSFPATNSSGTLAMRALSVVTQVFTATGTYTPTAGMLYCIIEVLGSGGGGGSVNTSGAANAAGGGGGGAGGYAKKTVSAATIGASQAVTVNNAGAGGASGGTNTGATGGTVSVGAIVSATGGVGGVGGLPATIAAALGGLGGVGSSGDVNANGAPGMPGFGVALLGIGGVGGSTSYGGGGRGSVSGGAAAAGNAGTLYGSGGGGASVGPNASTAAGADGAKGIVIITEYVIA